MMRTYPFSAIVGQKKLKLGLILNVINPAIGGLLVRGEKGTAKSTAVRSLSALLPEIRIVKGCPYSCDPDQPQQFCGQCRKNAAKIRSAGRHVRVITLPLNATEDRVAGGIDFTSAVKSGVRKLQPGLLAMAHRSILYVDEVNLLDDHLVDILLDAAASGENRIEREGISFCHWSRFILVGTMNPEEGELRPQFLDRFGLCIDVFAESDRDRRVLMMQRREAFDADPDGFIREFAHENEKTAKSIQRAREMVADVRMPSRLRTLITEMCCANNVAGHRADLVIEQAARALAAYQDREEVTMADIAEVALFAFAHRRRDPAPPPPPSEHEKEHEQDSGDQRDHQEQQHEHKDDSSGHEQEQSAQPQSRSSDKGPPSDQNGSSGAADETSLEKPGENSTDRVFEMGEPFRVKRLAAPKDRIFRRGSGRRSGTRVSQRQGRYVKSSMKHGSGDIALDATLRAASPYQAGRAGHHNLAVSIRPEDIREKIREKRIGDFLLFVVDASGSMGARGRMAASKGAVLSLLLDAYQKRDRVAMVSFRKDEAHLNLPPTSSIQLAAHLLKEMPVGGRTPLSAGLVKSYEVVRNHLLRDPVARPIVIIITDGKSNVALTDREPTSEAFEIGAKMAEDDRIQLIVVDTESQGLVNFGLTAKLAATMNARYFKIEDLKADSLINIIRR